MKSSTYNVFFSHEDHYIGFNSLTHEFIMLDPVLYDFFNIGKKKEDFKELQSIHPSFFQFLIDKGFLIASEIDEFEKVKEISKTIDNNASEFRLIVNPTMNCNFKCWYCYESHIKDSKMDDNTIKAVIKFSENTILNQKGIKKFTLSFFGGEPLLYFDKVIRPILSNVHKICKENNVAFSAGMTTNGLLIDEEKISFCSQYNLTGFQITLDGAKERHDKVRFISKDRGSYDEIVNNIKLIAKYGLHVQVRINCSTDTMEDIENVIDSFKNLSEIELKYLQFNFHKVWQEVEKISDKINNAQTLFHQAGLDVGGISNNVSMNLYDSCYADKRYQATINYNGEVFKCTARDFVNNSGEGQLTNEGEIIWNSKYEKRLSSKFNNPPCKQCMILPLCTGGCSQHAVENEGKEYCVMNFDEEAKRQLVIDKFKSIVIN